MPIVNTQTGSLSSQGRVKPWRFGGELAILITVLVLLQPNLTQYKQGLTGSRTSRRSLFFEMTEVHLLPGQQYRLLTLCAHYDL